MDAGLAGCLVLGHSFLTKLLMTVVFRGPGSVSDGLAPKVHNWMQVKDKLAAHPTFAIVSASQLNEAEYAPLFCAALFFCKSQNIDLPIASALAVAGQVCYFWPRWIMATPERYNVRGMLFVCFPPSPVLSCELKLWISPLTHSHVHPHRTASPFTCPAPSCVTVSCLCCCVGLLDNQCSCSTTCLTSHLIFFPAGGPLQPRLACSRGAFSTPSELLRCSANTVDQRSATVSYRRYLRRYLGTKVRYIEYTA